MVFLFYFFVGGGTNERLRTEHVISGPMRGLKKLNLMAQTHKQTDGHGDSMTESAQWGRFSDNYIRTYKLYMVVLLIEYEWQCFLTQPWLQGASLKGIKSNSEVTFINFFFPQRIYL